MVSGNFSFIKTILLLLVFILTFNVISAGGSNDNDPENVHSEEESEFDPSEFIIDHIKDSHEWHIITTSKGKHISIPLPVIVYSKNSGLHAFMSSKLAHGHIYSGFMIPHDGEHKGKVIEVNENGEYLASTLDFSITK